MKLSFIVNAYDRPDHLRTVLSSIAVQTHRDMEVIVVDNAVNDDFSIAHATLLTQIFAHTNICTMYMRTKGPMCYHSAEVGAFAATGDYICFPSDDSYYVPKFAEKMLSKAEAENLDWVYCDIVYDERCGHGRYMQVETRPYLNWIDKMAFILRRSGFNGFPDKPDADLPAPCDGYLAERLRNDPSIRHSKVIDCLGVHN